VADNARDIEIGAEFICESADCGRLASHLDTVKGCKEYGALQKELGQDADPFRQAFHRSHPWRTPDQMIRRASELASAFGTDEIMFIFKYGSMPMAATKKSMRLFAEEVMAALKGLSPEAMGVDSRAAQTPIAQQQGAK
jgi:hypothetical protein